MDLYMNSHIWFVLVMGVVVFGILEWAKRATDYTPKYKPVAPQIKIEETQPISVETAPSVPSIKDRLIDILNNLNLQYELREDGLIYVSYQGEWFRFIYKEGRYMVHIQDSQWYEAPLDDIDNLSILHRSVNECNIVGYNRLVYTYYQEVNKVAIHTLREILVNPQISDLDHYVRITLDDMLRSHHLFYNIMEDCRREQEHARNNHNA